MGTIGPGPAMTATLLDGELLAARIRAEVTDRVARLRSAGVVAGLGTILVGDDGPSARYVAMKHADCAEVGMYSAHEHLPADVSQAELEAVVARFNADPQIHAYLVQLPLPEGLDEERVLLAVDPDKDVDGLHPVNLGTAGHGGRRPAPVHAGRHRGAAERQRRPGGGEARGDHRPGPDHRAPAVAPPGHEAARVQRRRHRGPHRRGRPAPAWSGRATWWSPPPAGPAW